MPDTTTALQSETADMICRREYGDESGYVEAVLAANPGLAAIGPALPMGTIVVLPEIAAAFEVTPVVTLWD